MKTKLYAFWKYSYFSYVYGVPVLRMRKDGAIKAEGYGGYFMPIKLMPIEDGKRLMKELECLERKEREARNKLHAGFVKRRNELAPFLIGIK